MHPFALGMPEHLRGSRRPHRFALQALAAGHAQIGPHPAVAARTAASELAPTPTDVVVLGFLLLLGGFTLARHPSPAPLLAAIALFGAATLLAARLAGRSRAAHVVHDFLPIATVIGLFELLGWIVPEANTARWDATFAAIDARLFGGLPAAWFGLLGRPWWLVDAAALAYVAYYFAPVALGVALYAAGRAGEFRDFAFAVVATLLASYAGYLLFPTAGPRLAPADELLLGGGVATRGVLAFIRAAEGNPLDAFPSGHTAVTLVSVGLGWRLQPRWRVPLAALAIGIVFSTVYLSFHYVVDVVAGAALGVVLLLALPSLARRLGAALGPRARVSDRRRRHASGRARG